VFDEIAPPFAGAVARVVLEDTTEADAAARVVARIDIPNVSFRPGDPPLWFSFQPLPLDPARHYEVRVHIDRTAGERYTPGDQITTQAYPVTVGTMQHLRMHLRGI